MRRRSLIIALAVAIPLGGIAVRCLSQEALQKEAERLAEVLNWQPGSVVGDIGAGEGELTVDAAKHVGATGRVYSTEIDPKKLAHLQELAGDRKNITALKAGDTETNLPHECCDSIFMRLVYHHLTKPAEVDASLFQSLKPGGLLAVIDMEPRAESLASGGRAGEPRRPRRPAENHDRGTHLRGLSGPEGLRRLGLRRLLRRVPETRSVKSLSFS